MKRLMTRKGLERLQSRIDELERTLRETQQEVGEATRQSSETWHDNAPYDAICADIRIHDERLKEAHMALRDCEILEYPHTLESNAVRYGLGVIFKIDQERMNFKIVGFGDNGTVKDRILYLSPLAQQLMGRKEDEIFNIELDQKRREVKIEKVYLLTDSDLI